MKNLEFRINQTKKQKANLIAAKVLTFKIIEKTYNFDNLNLKCELNGIYYEVRQVSTMDVKTQVWTVGNNFVYSKEGVNNNTYGELVNFVEVSK